MGALESLKGNSGGFIEPGNDDNIDILGNEDNGVIVQGDASTSSLSISVFNGSTTQKGVLKLSTNQEAIEGIDDSKAVTPNNLKYKLGSQTKNSIPIGNESDYAFEWSDPLKNGELLIGVSGSFPVSATLKAGAGITIQNSPGSITISSHSSGSFSWTIVSGTSELLSGNNGYIINTSEQVILTLPMFALPGEIIKIVGESGSWLLSQNDGQIIHLGTCSTTFGSSGYIGSTENHDCIEIVCTNENKTFIISSSQGNLLVI